MLVCKPALKHLVRARSTYAFDDNLKFRNVEYRRFLFVVCRQLSRIVGIRIRWIRLRFQTGMVAVQYYLPGVRAVVQRFQRRRDRRSQR